MFIGSIARTNLECDLVQRGGSLVDEKAVAAAAAAADSSSGAASADGASGGATSLGAPGSKGATIHVNKPKSCFSKGLNYT